MFVAGAFVLLGACALVLYHTENISAKTTEILFLFLSSLGTVMLAGATWLSLQETRKERKVPIKREELNNIIQPSINTAESNKKRLNDENAALLSLAYACKKRKILGKNKEENKKNRKNYNLLYTR